MSKLRRKLRQKAGGYKHSREAELWDVQKLHEKVERSNQAMKDDDDEEEEASATPTLDLAAQQTARPETLVYLLKDVAEDNSKSKAQLIQKLRSAVAPFLRHEDPKVKEFARRIDAHLDALEDAEVRGASRLERASFDTQDAAYAFRDAYDGTLQKKLWKRETRREGKKLARRQEKRVRRADKAAERGQVAMTRRAAGAAWFEMTGQDISGRLLGMDRTVLAAVESTFANEQLATTRQRQDEA